MNKTAILAGMLALVLCALPPAISPTAGTGKDAVSILGENRQIVKDDLGYEFLLGPPPRRIVSLAPNITEILFAIGLGERVVGVTRFCDFPPAAAGKAKIGGLSDPDLEKIQSLEPDLVIAYRGNPLEMVRKMRTLGLPVFVLDEGDRLAQLPEIITRIGRVTRREMESAFLVRRLKEKMSTIRSRLEKAPSRVRAFLLLPGEGLWTCGSQSYVHDLLEEAAAVNIAAGIPRAWAPYNREALLAQDPDVVVLLASSRGSFEDDSKRLKTDPRLRHLRAVRLKRLVFLDENKTSRFGPRLVDAYLDLARALHPECF